jgi:hypothetical protein
MSKPIQAPNLNRIREAWFQRAERERRSKADAERLGRLLDQLPAGERERLIDAYAREVQRRMREERWTQAAAERETEAIIAMRAQEWIACAAYRRSHGEPDADGAPRTELERSYAITEQIMRKNPSVSVKLSDAMRTLLLRKQAEGTLPAHMERLL